MRTESTPFWNTLFTRHVAAAEIRYNAGIVHPPARPLAPAVLFREERAGNRRAPGGLFSVTQRTSKTDVCIVNPGWRALGNDRAPKTARENRGRVTRQTSWADTLPGIFHAAFSEFEAKCQTVTRLMDRRLKLGL